MTRLFRVGNVDDLSIPHAYPSSGQLGKKRFVSCHVLPLSTGSRGRRKLLTVKVEKNRRLQQNLKNAASVRDKAMPDEAIGKAHLRARYERQRGRGNIVGELSR